MTPTVTIYIDNLPYKADPERNLLDACLSLGFDLPYFCWHPAMGSVGACRQCAVKLFRNEKDTRGKIAMACMTPVTDGLRLSIDDPEARAFRKTIIEWLMVNHPHDCPVCDEGSECHLQDMTLMTGHTYRRTRFKKRSYRNQNLGPLVNHEMNRCIQCYRCVRYYRDIAGGRDLDVFGAHDHIYFGRQADGVLESEFSGNLVEVCPTGVFTDKTLGRHYTRKWDLQTAPSICMHCGLGCNTIPGERYNELRRIRTRYNGHVNGTWLCDRGRYGYEFVNSDRRVRWPMLRNPASGALEPVSRERALQHLASILPPVGKMIGIGSPRASLESNFALRTLVGPTHFYTGLPHSEIHLASAMLKILRKGPARTPSLAEVGLCDAVLILGEDVTQAVPLLALTLRQAARREPMKALGKLKIPEWLDHAAREAIQGATGPFTIATPGETRLDDLATRTVRGAPDDLARLGFAIAHELDPGAPAVDGLEEEAQEMAREIALALKQADRPLIVSGPSCGSESVIDAAANVAWALCKAGRPAQLSFTMPECNSMGMAIMGGGDREHARKAIESGIIETIVVLENDLYRRWDAETINTYLGKVRHIVAIDSVDSPTTAKAELILPAGTFAEADGTLVNSEGRAQRFYQVFAPRGEIQEGWRWVRDAMDAAGRSEAREWRNLDAIGQALVTELPVFQPILKIAPNAGFRIAGQKIPRQPHRYSGRTAMTANETVHEPKPPEDPDSPLAFSMEGYGGQPPSALIPFFWAPGWDSDQAINKFQSEVGGPLRGGDPGVRLVEPHKEAEVAYQGQPPAAFKSHPGEWLIVPLYHIFGSEELSILSPPIAELAPKPYLGLGEEDAAAMQVQPDEEMEVTLAGKIHHLPVKIRPGLPQGLAGLPVGLPELHGISLPEWGKIGKAGPK